MAEVSNNATGLTLPLAPVQQGLFFHYIRKKSKDYLEQMICDIAGDLDVALFEHTLNQLIERHDALRTVFLHEGADYMQQVILDRKVVQLDYRDASGEADPEHYVRLCVAVEADKNLDLSKSACRSKLIKVAEGKYVFLCTYHHLMMDSWTIKLLEEDFCRLYYAGMEGAADPEKARYSYRLYVDWVGAQDQEKAKRYWRNYLSRCSHLKEARLPRQNNVKRRKTITVVFERELVRLVEEIAKNNRATVNSVLLAAWGVYELDHNQASEGIIGCVTFGRIIPLKHADKIAGLFVNAIPLYVNRDGSAAALIANLQKDVFSAAGYAYLSLSDVMASGGLSPSHIYSFVNFSIDSERIDNEYARKLPFRVDNIRYNEQANYDVYLDVYLKQESIQLKIHFDADRYFFSESRVKDKMTRVLNGLCVQPPLPVKDILNGLEPENELNENANFQF